MSIFDGYVNLCSNDNNEPKPKSLEPKFDYNKPSTYSKSVIFHPDLHSMFSDMQARTIIETVFREMDFGDTIELNVEYFGSKSEIDVITDSYQHARLVWKFVTNTGHILLHGYDFGHMYKGCPNPTFSPKKNVRDVE